MSPLCQAYPKTELWKAASRVLDSEISSLDRSGSKLLAPAGFYVQIPWVEKLTSHATPTNWRWHIVAKALPPGSTELS